jgi:sporulation protein YtfJ
MSDIPLKEIIDAALSKIGTVGDVNTVIGEPMTLSGGITVIPYSKVSVGFASGGADYTGKKTSEKKNFVGGNGAGVTVEPLGFIIITGDRIETVDIQHPAPAPAPSGVVKVMDTVNELTDKAPALIEKIKDIFAKKKETSTDDLSNSSNT